MKSKLAKTYALGRTVAVLVSCWFFLAIFVQGASYLRRFVAPTVVTWEVSPVLNIWPSAIIIGVLFSVVYTRDTYYPRGTGPLLKTILGALGGGVLLGAIFVNCLLCFMAFFNCYFDNGPVVEHHVVVVEKVVQHTKHRSYYYIIVPDWHTADEGNLLKIYIGSNVEGDYELRERVGKLSHVSVSTRPGLFGLEWVVGVEQP